MTRQDFRLIAEVIADAGKFGDKEHLVRCRVLAELADSFARELASTNPRFDRQRFLDACCLPGGSNAEEPTRVWESS